MKSFFDLAKPKLPFAFLITFGIFATGVVIIDIVNAVSDPASTASLPKTILLTILSAFAMTIVLLAIAVAVEYVKYRMKEKTLKKYPFSDLEKEGFVKTIFLVNNRWFINDIAYVKLVRGYPVFVNSHQKNVVEMVVGETSFKETFDVSTIATPTLKQLEPLIDSYVKYLEGKAIDPKSLVQAYDKYLANLKWKQAMSGATGG